LFTRYCSGGYVFVGKLQFPGVFKAMPPKGWRKGVEVKTRRNLMGEIFSN
jgi:hypothetical protein